MSQRGRVSLEAGNVRKHIPPPEPPEEKQPQLPVLGLWPLELQGNESVLFWVIGLVVLCDNSGRKSIQSIFIDFKSVAWDISVLTVHASNSSITKY